MKILSNGTIAAVPAGSATGKFLDARGRLRYTEATTEKGVYAPDGSVYVEVVNATTGSGSYNARGNWRVTKSTGVGINAPNGALRITDEA